MKLKDSEYTSLEREPKITTIIKDNPYKANVEIEKDELVIRPDLAAIYKAIGKKHSGGGIKAYLPENSFVISDDKSLAFTKEEHDLLELKKGGSSSTNKNTPADVLKRNIDVKHYNKMTSILNDTKKDEFSKRTAAMMLSKYEDVLGKVAFGQEAKKGFPTGVPEFAQDATSQINEITHEKMEEQTQYMKKGGNVYGKMQPGGLIKKKPLFGQMIGLKDDISTYNPFMTDVLTGIESYKGQPTYQNIQKAINVNPYIKSPNSQPLSTNKSGQTSYGRPYTTDQLFSPALTGYGMTHDDMIYAPTAHNNPIQYLDSPQHRQKTGTYGSDHDVNEFKQRHDWYFKDKPNWDAKNSKDVLDFQNQYNQITQKQIGEDYFGGVGFRAKDGLLGKYTYNAPNFFGKSKPNVLDGPSQATGDCPCGIDRLGACLPCDDKNIPAPAPKPNTIEPKEVRKQQPWKFSNWQKLDMAQGALDAASVRQEFPYRSQVKSPLVEMERLNPQAALNNVDNGVFGATQASRGLNPYMAAGIGASTFGKGLDGKGQVQSQYDNQNVQIANQQNAMNTQVQGNDLRFNVGADQQYYQETVKGRQNFDNLKQFQRNRFREILNGNVQDNQTLQYNMMTQNNPAFGYNYKDGEFFLTGKNPLNVQTGSDMNLMNELQSTLLRKLQSGTLTPAEASMFRTMSMRSNKIAKKGGKITNPYK